MTTPTAPATGRRNISPRGHALAAPTVRGPSPLEFLVGAILIAIFLYELLFNLTPERTRLAMAAGLAGGIVLLSVVWILARPRIWRIILFSLLLVVAGAWVVAEASGSGRLDFTKGIRFVMPLFFALWIIELRHAIKPRLVLSLAATTLAVATLSSILRPQEIIGSLLRLPPFTGGEEGAHASAYVVALCALLLHQLSLNKSISKRLTWSLLALAAVLLIGMRVATPIFMLVNYGLLHILLTRQLKGGTKALLWFTMLAALIAVLGWHEAMQEDLRGGAAASVDNLGSGRIGTWLERIDILAERDVVTLLFGSGPGSDSFYSYIWWWEKKDSHNDFLTIIFESGFVGLLAVMLFLYLLFRRLGRDGVPLIFFLLAGSAVSNSLLQRPIIATLFWLAVALAAVRVDQRLRARWWQQMHRRRPRRRNGLARAGPGRP